MSTEQPAAAQNKGIGCLGIVVIVFVIGTLASMCDGGSTSDAGDEYGAKDACQSWVKDQLKAPSTADFSNVSVTGGSGSWTVTGDVDAENSFGAKLRTGWTCDVRLEGDTYRGNATLLDDLG
jgi:hypothetical protein